MNYVPSSPWNDIIHMSYTGTLLLQHYINKHYGQALHFADSLLYFYGRGAWVGKWHLVISCWKSIFCVYVFHRKQTLVFPFMSGCWQCSICRTEGLSYVLAWTWANSVDKWVVIPLVILCHKLTRKPRKLKVLKSKRIIHEYLLNTPLHEQHLHSTTY